MVGRVALSLVRMVVVLVAALVLVALAPVPGSGGSAGGALVGPVARAGAAASGTCASSDELEVLRLVNERRAEFGLAPLVLSATLSAAADNHSADMASNDYFSHTLFDGTPWSQNIRNFGYDYDTWKGENLAAGNSTAYDTFMQWVNSPTHDANMLSPNFVAIGIGHVSAPGSTWGDYWTQTFGGYADGEPALCGGADAPMTLTGDTGSGDTGTDGKTVSSPIKTADKARKGA